MMKKLTNKELLGLGSALLLAGGASIAVAQTGTPGPSSVLSPLSEALAAGAVGEQADGYLGIRGAVSSVVRAEVDAINIKRRAVYTRLAQTKGVTPKEVAAAVGCETLASRVAVGRAYQLADGTWQVRKAGQVIDLPGYCGS